jgi:hypothetical protein
VLLAALFSHPVASCRQDPYGLSFMKLKIVDDKFFMETPDLQGVLVKWLYSLVTEGLPNHRPEF